MKLSADNSDDRSGGKPRRQQTFAPDGAAVNAQTARSPVTTHADRQTLWLSVASIFDELTGLLDRLRQIEETLAQDESLQPAHSLFDSLDESSRALLVQIETAAAQAGGIDGELADALDGTSFAIRHELRRVFETELLLVDSGQPQPQLRAEMTRAHGLLTNCLQQSVYTIARFFDPQLTPAELFSDVKLRQEQSVTLHEQLCALLEIVSRAETEMSLNSCLAAVKGSKVFGVKYLHFLMYRDWAEFESFADKISSAHNAVEMQPLLHQFARYLETLINHVGMRAALTARPAND